MQCDPSSPVFEIVYRSLYAWETKLMQQALENEGIESFTDNDNMVTINWLYSNATGGVRLRVQAKDAERARQILLKKENTNASQYSLPEMRQLKDSHRPPSRRSPTRVLPASRYSIIFS